MKIIFPIIITLYNRPNHTKKILDSISKCINSKNHKYYIFCDGPRNNKDLNKIKNIRILVKEFSKSFNVKYFFQRKNIGLVKNIINSIEFVMKKHKAAIILEDDLILHKEFLLFLNNSLNKYLNNKKIFQISGYSYPVCKNKKKNYFLSLTSCWGWGITKYQWINFFKFFNNKIEIKKNYLDILESKNKKKLFNYYNSYNYLGMLKKSLINDVNSWGVIFYLYLFLKKKLTYFPNKSLVINNGFDGSGNHQSNNELFKDKFANRTLGRNPKKIANCNIARNEIINFFSSNLSLYGKIKNKIYAKFF